VNFILQSLGFFLLSTISGPPLPPSQVLLTDLSNNSLRLSWNFLSTAPVNSTFAVTVLRNNSVTREESTYTIVNLTVTNAVVAYNLSYCDITYVWVMAENEAGKSKLSEVAKWVPPYQQEYPPILIRHSLSRDSAGVRLTVELQVNVLHSAPIVHDLDDGGCNTVFLQVPSVCPEYLAAVFDVELSNSSGTVIRVWRQSELGHREEGLPTGQVFSLQVKSEGYSVSARESFGWFNCVIVELKLKWSLLINVSLTCSIYTVSYGMYT